MIVIPQTIIEMSFSVWLQGFIDGRLALELPVGQSASPNHSLVPGKGNVADTFADFTAANNTAHQGAWGTSIVEPDSRRGNTKFDGHLGKLFSKIHTYCLRCDLL